MILAETCPSCSYLITWFVGLLLKITLKGLLGDWKCLWSMFVIWFLNITRKSRNFHAFTQAYLAHAQTNFPAATKSNFQTMLFHEEDKFELLSHLYSVLLWQNRRLSLCQKPFGFACIEPTMNSKGLKHTKCVEVPLFVVNLALLYAFLITVSHLLAWVTIANHEKTIEELKEILSTRNEEQKQESLNEETLKRDDVEKTTLQDSNVLKVGFLCFP